MRVAVKLQSTDKKHVPRWSNDVYEISDVEHVPGIGNKYKITIINEGGKKSKEEFLRKDVIPAIAEGEEPEREKEPMQNKQKEKKHGENRKKNSKALATVRDDPDSTFTAGIVEGKRKNK